MLPTDFPWNLKHLQPKEMKSTLNKSYLHSSIFIGIWRSAPELWANHREKSSTLMDCCFEKKHFQKKLYKIRKSYFDTKNWSLKSGALTLGHPFIKYSHLYFFFPCFKLRLFDGETAGKRTSVCDVADFLSYFTYVWN